MSFNFNALILGTGLFFALAVSLSANPAHLDPTFGNGGKIITTGIGVILDIAIQQDGKIVAVDGTRNCPLQCERFARRFIRRQRNSYYPARR